MQLVQKKIWNRITEDVSFRSCPFNHHMQRKKKRSAATGYKVRRHALDQARTLCNSILLYVDVTSFPGRSCWCKRPALERIQDPLRRRNFSALKTPSKLSSKSLFGLEAPFILARSSFQHLKPLQALEAPLQALEAPFKLFKRLKPP